MHCDQTSVTGKMLNKSTIHLPVRGKLQALLRVFFIAAVTCCLLLSAPTPGAAFAVPAMLAGATIGIGSMVIKGIEHMRCMFTECCSSEWIEPDMQKMRTDMRRRVFGQHIAVELVLDALETHFSKPNTGNALSFCFNGRTGVGKNFITQIVADSLYRKGTESKYYHVINGQQFTDPTKAYEYRSMLGAWVRNNVTDCEKYNIFVFDEVDKMPPNVLDVLTEFLEFYTSVNKVNYRHTIFFFLSNVGAETISDIALRHYEDGKLREELTLKHFEAAIQKVVYKQLNEQLGGLYQSQLIKKEVINHYVPFLPLQRSHVIECINSEFVFRNITEHVSHELVEKIANSLEYIPPDLQLYAASGCKRVMAKALAFWQKEKKEMFSSH